jgi:hypothetical protein
MAANSLDVANNAGMRVVLHVARSDQSTGVSAEGLQFRSAWADAVIFCQRHGRHDPHIVQTFYLDFEDAVRFCRRSLSVMTRVSLTPRLFLRSEISPQQSGPHDLSGCGDNPCDDLPRWRSRLPDPPSAVSP